MDKNTMCATAIALNERQMTGNNEKEATNLSEGEELQNRRFGIIDIWNIRRSARTFKIHNRISRL